MGGCCDIPHPVDSVGEKGFRKGGKNSLELLLDVSQVGKDDANAKVAWGSMEGD